MTLDYAESTTFKTSDTPLAAYLLSEGFELVDIEYTRGKTAFYIFLNDNSKLHDCVRDFQLGRALGNVSQYEENRRKLLKTIKDELPWFRKHKIEGEAQP